MDEVIDEVMDKVDAESNSNRLTLPDPVNLSKNVVNTETSVTGMSDKGKDPVNPSKNVVDTETSITGMSDKGKATMAKKNMKVPATEKPMQPGDKKTARYICLSIYLTSNC